MRVDIPQLEKKHGILIQPCADSVQDRRHTACILVLHLFLPSYSASFYCSYSITFRIPEHYKFISLFKFLGKVLHLLAYPILIQSVFEVPYNPNP